ncbi:MAG: hypothetical protein ACO25B_00150 [Chitinophagaceae bacterium]
MNKKILTTIGILALIAALAMKLMGNRSSRLTELLEFWWIPLPVALICLILAARKSS